MLLMFSSELYQPKSKLECVAQYTLFGNVISLESVTVVNSPRDALLLTFSDAKLSVVECDPENHDLRTISCISLTFAEVSRVLVRPSVFENEVKLIRSVLNCLKQNCSNPCMSWPRIIQRS